MLLTAQWWCDGGYHKMAAVESSEARRETCWAFGSIVLTEKMIALTFSWSGVRCCSDRPLTLTTQLTNQPELNPSWEATVFLTTQFPNVLIPECSLPCSQEPNSGSCSEPDETSPYCPSPFHLSASTLTSSNLRLGRPVVSLFALLFPFVLYVMPIQSSSWSF
jgi:hypothetical protein